MNHPDIDYMLVMARRREALAEAAQSRLFAEARATLEARDTLRENAGEPQRRASRLGGALRLGLARVLSWAGEHLLAWSCRLQYHGALAAPDAEQPAPCTS